MKKPFTIMIFGATGDLARKKLFPSLFELSKTGQFPHGTVIIALSRRSWTDHEFRSFITASLETSEEFSVFGEEFLRSVVYHQLQFDDDKAYDSLAEKVRSLDRETIRNKLIYLSISPEAHTATLTRIGTILPTLRYRGAAVRILVEKPFGKNSRTALAFNTLLRKFFDEKEIYRIDHYLFKWPLQAFLKERMENKALENAWSNQCVERLEIRLLEEKGIDARAFYDSVGALRDVGQNHLLQMLAVATMPLPKKKTQQAYRRARTIVLKSLRQLPLRESSPALRGQYEGYRDESSNPVSETETYFKVMCEVRMGRWRGVPIVIESGKAAGTSVVEIKAHFKESCGGGIMRWVIQPQFSTEFPGWLTLAGSYHSPSDAYSNLFLDALDGNRTHFPSFIEIKASWRLIESVRRAWRKLPLVVYKKGELL
jgi:glucose-6-phosphate 1-dehydrogenase